MEYKEVMKELESFGTAQNRKIYGRHGAYGEFFGVSFANLNKLQKKIKKDTKLARELFKSGNLDAQTLATMVADPDEFSEKELDSWVKKMKYYPLVDEFVKNLVNKTKFSKKKIEEWINSDDEWIGRAGWQLLALYVMTENDLTDNYYEKYLLIIEKNIHTSKNRTKEAMNTALISIGTRNKNLMKKALQIANEIGVVEIDHGETNCKTPEAVAYINKTWAHKRKKKK